jgi:hypothetical protein
MQSNPLEMDRRYVGTCVAIFRLEEYAKQENRMKQVANRDITEDRTRENLKLYNLKFISEAHYILEYKLKQYICYTTHFRRHNAENTITCGPII